MAAPSGACKCLHCGTIFFPDPHNRHHQRFCFQPACRQASKRESQRRWLARPENRDYFRGPDQVARVQAWRRAHPGYWRRRSPKAPDALQDVCPKQPPPPPPVATSEVTAGTVPTASLTPTRVAASPGDLGPGMRDDRQHSGRCACRMRLHLPALP